MNSKFLLSDQIALLTKMFLHSGAFLSEEDRHIYFNLIEHLEHLEETQHKHAAGIHRHHQEPQPNSSVTAGQIEKGNLGRMHALEDFSPEQVVRTFVQCWNEMNFELEHNCLSKHFSTGTGPRPSLNQYVEERVQRSQMRDHIGIRTKEIIEISPASVHGNKASVVCVERHVRSEGENVLIYREYSLIHEDGCWRILKYENKTTPNA